MSANGFSCADCQVQGCALGNGDYPKTCPTREMTDEARAANAAAYDEDEFALKVMRAAADVSTQAYANRWCRVEETLQFLRNMGWSRIGIASCSGLSREAAIFAKILRAQGFEPYGAACKVGSIPKARFQATESCCDYGAISCNPIMQAQLLKEAGTEVNIIIGLCVGHDMLFSRYSEAPVITLVAKDRALFHNPVGALYASETPSFYSALQKPCDQQP